MTATTRIQLTVNEVPHSLQVSSDESLLDILRDRLQLKGTKCGCNVGACGCCTVILGDKAIRSCTVEPKQLDGAKIETIESLSSNGTLHPLQQAFIDRQGGQCGFCTPGMIMTAKALLDENPKPDDRAIKHALRVNLCRCTGYQPIIDAVKQASGQLPVDETAEGLELVGLEKDTLWVGTSVPRRDAEDLVMGRAEFTDDIPDPPGCLHLVAKRSERAHAIIKSIDSSAAEKIPGVVRVITAADIPGDNRYGKIIRDIPVLAGDRVRSYADAVALVVADSYKTAQQGCEAIVVRYEDLTPLFDPEQALVKGAPQVHPKGNLLYEFDIIKGNVDKGFEQADVNVEGEFSTGRVDHAQLEPEAALAYFDGSGKLCLKAPTQHVFFDRLNIIRALGLPKDDVRVIQPPVGGSFGKREDVYGQIHCALAAFLTRCPVRTRYSREETFQSTQKRHPARIRIQLGATNDGKLTAFKADVLSDTGAYASWGPNVLRKICVHVSGPYEIPNVQVHGVSVYTNNVFCGAMRGFGTPQAVFASESLLDTLAEKLNMDPVELRKLNSFKPGSKTATGQVVQTTPGRKTIELAADKVEWGQPFDRTVSDAPHLRRGRGVASLWYGIGFGSGIPDRGNAILELTKTGQVRVFVSTVDYGQGSNTIFPQIAAEALGLKPTDVEMVTGDTDTTPNCGSTVATRQTFVTGNAIKLACEQLRVDILAVAARLLECDEEQVMVRDGLAYAEKDPSRTIHASELYASFERFGKPMRRESIFKGDRYTEPLDPKTGQGNAYHPIAYGTQIAEVTVNTHTGKVKVDRIVACHYIGRAINPESVRGQVLGGISMGYGYALSEDCKSVGGMIKADNFGRYKMHRISDTPRYDVILLEDPEPTGPYGAIGIGEPPTVATAPAIANAIYDAVGVRITSLPITANKIKSALENVTVGP